MARWTLVDWHGIPCLREPGPSLPPHSTSHRSHFHGRRCTDTDDNRPTMRVLVTGGTGFIGQALVAELLAGGASVTVIARTPQRASALGGGRVSVLGVGDDRQLDRAISAHDAVVNLSGAPMLGGRWTASRRALLRDSRVGTTTRLVDAVARTHTPPRVFVSGSAIGVYGDRGDEILDEGSAPGTDFLAGLCQDWEAASRPAEAAGVRVVQLRTGVVLGRGGALAQMLPPFRMGPGGPVGPGTQWMSWIHVTDICRVILAAIDDGRLSGPVNVVAAAPVPNREFATALGRVLRRPARLRTPAGLLRLMFGEAADVLLASQRVMPAVLSRVGFVYQHPSLDDALRASLGR